MTRGRIGMRTGVRFGIVAAVALAASLVGPQAWATHGLPHGGQVIVETIFEHVVVEDVTTNVVVTGVDPGFTLTVPETDDVATIEAAVAAQLPPGSGFTVTVDKVLTGTTSDVTTDLEVTVSEDAEYIGDLNNPDSLLVIAGTITYTTIETTTETRHYTRTVTIHISGLTPATAEDCKNGGWMSLVDHNDRPFENQGDCVSYVATDTRNLAAG